MFLQLAEGENNGNYGALAENSVMDNYIYIPGGFLPEFPNEAYVRADYFANNYDPATASAIVDQLASMQTKGLSVVGVGAVATAGVNLAKKLIQNRAQKVASGQAKPLFKPGGLFDRAKQKLQGLKTAPEVQTKNFPNIDVNANVGGQEFGVTYSKPEDQPAPTSFFQKYKTPLLIGGGALILIGGAYMLTRKKRR
jgi:hypothetical protein